MSAASTAGQVVKKVRFDSGYDHLHAELRRLDLIIARRVQRFRLEIAETEARVPAAPTYVSDQEVDWLLQRPHSYGWQHDSIQQIEKEIAALTRMIDAAAAASEREGIFLPLRQLARLFSLSRLEQQAVLICLAPELRRKYDRIYAYLQDDITRKRPSLDLVLDLLVDEESERWEARARLDEGCGLFVHKLVYATEDSNSPSGSSGLARLLQLDSRILQFILGNGQIDTRVAKFARLVSLEQYMPCADLAQLNDLRRLINNSLQDGVAIRRLQLHLQGTEGIGQRDLAIALCQALGYPLLLVDGRALSAAAGQSETVLSLLCRESLLLQAPLLIENIDDWLLDENTARSRLATLGRALNRYFWLSFTSAGKSWPSTQMPADAALLNIPVQLPDNEQQASVWQQALTGVKIDATQQELDHLIQQFRLSRHQIELVSQRLQLQGRGSERLALSVLARACADVSHHGLGELAVRVKAQYQWEDLVLPVELRDWLQNICAQVRFRRRVFDQWGFAQKLPYGRGLSVLFSGNPGTGKTMAAQVMANDLGLELYKIDLSGVVSKYIGETEKNLSRVFSEAQTSNAILFFDEADALFGKRTGVSDAHDRYANIEVSYLLQKMEEYDGIVILATNLRNNIDEAFVRRIRFILEFPFPDIDSRRQIWSKSIPAAMPKADDIDYQWLAERIKVAGGNIKNIVLNAAFSAARENEPLNMLHLLGGCKQEFQKIGKLWDEAAMRYQKQAVEVT